MKVSLIDGVAGKGILVVGLAYEDGKKSSLVIESGDLVLDSKPLLETLKTMGASGKADEVIKIPALGFQLLVFTGLGKVSRKYPHELLRRAAGAASRSLAGNEAIAFSLPDHDLASLNEISCYFHHNSYFSGQVCRGKGDSGARNYCWRVHRARKKLG